MVSGGTCDSLARRSNNCTCSTRKLRNCSGLGWCGVTRICGIKFNNGFAATASELRSALGIASRSAIFSAIEAEWHLTAEALSLITGDRQRLAHNASLARSIRHRFPYIDPLHHLQVELLRRWRAAPGDERVQTGIHICINGIAAGLRNTG